MKSFDEWFNTYENLQCDKDSCEDAFEAGQQSKQAEVDELQKRVGDALKELECIYFYKTQNSNNTIKILKGNTNDH